MKTKALVASLALVSNLVFADVAVIVHPSNPNTLDASELSRIFLGKVKNFPDGSQAVPINQGESTAATGEFNSKVLSKSASQLKAYWSKLVFTGKGTPPKAVGSDADAISLVASNPNIIGYVDASKVDASVKVIATY